MSILKKIREVYNAIKARKIEKTSLEAQDTSPKPLNEATSEPKGPATTPVSDVSKVVQTTSQPSIAVKSHTVPSPLLTLPSEISSPRTIIEGGPGETYIIHTVYPASKPDPKKHSKGPDIPLPNRHSGR